MYISRGFKVASEDDAPLASAEAAGHAPPQTLDYLLIHDRLTALERVGMLRDRGVLSEPEFALEKERVLQLPGEELILRPHRPPQGPPLFGRLINWKVLTLGCLLGFGLAAFTRLEATLHALEQVQAIIS